MVRQVSGNPLSLTLLPHDAATPPSYTGQHWRDRLDLSPRRLPTKTFLPKPSEPHSRPASVNHARTEVCSTEIEDFGPPNRPVPSRIIGIMCGMAHTSREGWSKLVRRDFESENLGFEGDDNVWIRTDRNHSDYLCDRLDRTKSVTSESHRRR